MNVDFPFPRKVYQAPPACGVTPHTLLEFGPNVDVALNVLPVSILGRLSNGKKIAVSHSSLIAAVSIGGVPIEELDDENVVVVDVDIVCVLGVEVVCVLDVEVVCVLDVEVVCVLDVADSSISSMGTMFSEPSSFVTV